MSSQMDGLANFKAVEFQDAPLACGAPVTLIRGGNRATKTTVAAVKVALACRPIIPLQLSSGLCLENRQCVPIRVAVLADDRDHIRDTMFPFLFDFHSKPGIMGRMIPANEIQHIEWINENEKIPAWVRLRTGTQIDFLTSFSADGPKYDLAWLDEKRPLGINIDDIREQCARFVWSTWPTQADEQLLALHREASDRGPVREFRFRFLDNPFISEVDQNSLLSSWAALGNGYVSVRAEGLFPGEDGSREPKSA